MHSFSKAAKHCFVSQPTLSNQIRKLEQQFAILLFERNNRQVTITPAGQMMVASARRIIREVEQMKAISQIQIDPFAGQCQLGAFPTLAPYLFPSLAPALKDAMPDLRLLLREEKTQRLLELLHEGELDLAFIALPIEDEQLDAELLFNDDFLLAVHSSHELATKSEVSIDVLDKTELMLLEEGHCMRQQALDICRLQVSGEEQTFRATSLETLRQMVQAGTGITLVPGMAAQTETPRVSYIPFSSPAPSRQIALVTRKEQQPQVLYQRIASITKELFSPGRSCTLR
ncbi:DNA-binding transcriptional regulator OxyR [Aliidiomarina minuta]|uniref:DNA-binding transcriptional regulator OxyR n=1 Tax=Aliidiomarina minuta TaxID=880057 RepID=A0A432WA76_9GAMM|nr:LysR substrate-binding domain-containing protein [Aliidiomarina minuta]RUO26935.1 DNA-binding transcriptional regulator OxyR [Aliidiomarina minuta]